MKIGITGGIGSGKSHICKILQNMGFPVYNCDDEAKRLMVNNKDIINSIRKLISHDAYIEEQSSNDNITYVLNKPIIASYLFANKDNASKVNAIVHPIVKKDFERWASEQDAEHVLMECAILFESGFNDVVDKTILIYADDGKRIQRVVQRDGLSETDIRRRMEQQISTEDVLNKVDYIFDNSDNNTTETEINKFLIWLKKL